MSLSRHGGELLVFFVRDVKMVAHPLCNSLSHKGDEVDNPFVALLSASIKTSKEFYIVNHTLPLLLSSLNHYLILFQTPTDLNSPQ